MRRNLREDGGVMMEVVATPERLPALKAVAGLVLVALWGGAIWGYLRRGRIRRELVAEEAVPAPAPRMLLFVVLSALFVGFSALMLYFVFT